MWTISFIRHDIWYQGSVWRSKIELWFVDNILNDPDVTSPVFTAHSMGEAAQQAIEWMSEHSVRPN